MVVELMQHKQVSTPLEHTFTPGLYTRKIFMPKGTLIISKIHKTEHPFVVLSGRAAVWIEGTGVVMLEAGHLGITKPGTRRILYIHEDCEWATFHPTQLTDLEEIEKVLVDTFSDQHSVDQQIINALIHDNHAIPQS